MTTRKELGEMLITGKPMQESTSDFNGGAYVDMLNDADTFYLGHRSYRLKPTITYYRVYSAPNGMIDVGRQKLPFKDFSKWASQSCKLIKDFQIEE